MASRYFGGDVVMATAQVLHEGMAGSEDPRRLVAFEATHRPKSSLQSAVISLNGVIRILLNGVQGRRDQFVEHPRVDGRTVGRDLGRDRARAQRPGEEAPGGRQVTARR